MRYAIFVLLLLMFGCLQQEPGEVTELDLPDKTQESSDANDSSDGSTSSDTAESGETDDGADAASVPDEGSVDAANDTAANPSAPNPDWGSECEDAYDCEPYDPRNLCVMGKCEKAECVFRSDCKEKDHCFDGKCYLESELYAEFPACGVSVGCNITCSGCESGKRRCLVTGWSDGDDGKDYYICTDCNRDYDCKEGYKCVQHYCVKGPN